MLQQITQSETYRSGSPHSLLIASRISFLHASPPHHSLVQPQYLFLAWSLEPTCSWTKLWHCLWGALDSLAGRQDGCQAVFLPSSACTVSNHYMLVPYTLTAVDSLNRVENLLGWTINSIQMQHKQEKGTEYTKTRWIYWFPQWEPPVRMKSSLKRVVPQIIVSW